MSPPVVRTAFLDQAITPSARLQQLRNRLAGPALLELAVAGCLMVQGDEDHPPFALLGMVGHARLVDRRGPPEGGQLRLAVGQEVAQQLERLAQGKGRAGPCPGS